MFTIPWLMNFPPALWRQWTTSLLPLSDFIIHNLSKKQVQSIIFIFCSELSKLLREIPIPEKA